MPIATQHLSGRTSFENVLDAVSAVAVEVADARARDVSVLDCTDLLLQKLVQDRCIVFSPNGMSADLLYLSHTIDIVVAIRGGLFADEEVIRVCSGAVIWLTWTPDSGGSVVVDWVDGDAPRRVDYDAPETARWPDRSLFVLKSEAGRRVLFWAKSFPAFDRESGSRRLFDLARFFVTAGWSVHFVADEAADDRYERRLCESGVETSVGGEKHVGPLLRQISFDVAVLAFWREAEHRLDVVRRDSPETRIVVDSVDLHFVRNARHAYFHERSARIGRLDLDTGTQFVRELNVYAAADAVLTVSEVERGVLDTIIGQPGLAMTLPDVETIEPSTVPFGERSGILFLGNAWHAPNVDAVRYLCQDILPLVAPEVLRNHPVNLVGNGLGSLPGLEQFENIRCVDWVPSVVPYLNRSRVSVAPLRYGAGTKRKVLQSVLAGTPSVTTSVGAEGLLSGGAEGFLIADDPYEFAACVESLLVNENEWSRLAREGPVAMRATHSAVAVAGQFDRMVAEVMRREPKPARVEESLPASPKSGTSAAVGPLNFTPDIPIETVSAESNAFPRRAPPLSDRRDGLPGPSVLVVGIYLSGVPNHASQIVSNLDATRCFHVVQKWAAIGSRHPEANVQAVTRIELADAVPKYTLISALLENEDLRRYEFVVIIDDDIVLAANFLDRYLPIQSRLGFLLAQPARTANSYIDHPITERHEGVSARQTLFVECGPVVSVARAAYGVIFPFDPASPMGWGYEQVWAWQISRAGGKMGIIDAVPVDHSLRKPATFYDWSAANTGRDRLLAAREHLTLEDCYRVLNVTAAGDEWRIG